MKGCSQFHQKGIFELIMKEQSHLLNSAIKEIIFYEYFEIIYLLISKCIINIQDKKLLTPLHYAAYNNSKEVLELLIIKGADINAKDIIYLNIIILFLIKII